MQGAKHAYTLHIYSTYAYQPKMDDFEGLSQCLLHNLPNTVDGQNPARVDVVFISCMYNYSG